MADETLLSCRSLSIAATKSDTDMSCSFAISFSNPECILEADARVVAAADDKVLDD
jgi:hypothetical protein